MALLQVDGCRKVNLDDRFEAADKHMQTSQKTTEIEQGDEGNSTLTMLLYLSTINLQLLTWNFIRSWLNVVEKGVFLSLKLKNISYQQLLN